MSRLSRSGTLRHSSSVSPPATSSPLRPPSFPHSTSPSPSSPSPLSGIYSPHKRKAPPNSTAAEYEGIEEEDEEALDSDVDSMDGGGEVLRHSSFVAEYALANGHHGHNNHLQAVPVKSSSVSPTPAQAAVRASALTAALSAVRGYSPTSTQSTPSPTKSPSRPAIVVAVRPASPANGSPLTVPASASASAPLPATVLKGTGNSAITRMELDESEEEYASRSPLPDLSQPSPPPTAASPPPSASLSWPPAPSPSQLSDPSLLPLLRLSTGQRELLSAQLSQHIDLTLTLRRLLTGSLHPSSVDSESASILYRKAGDMLSSLCAVRVAHQRMYTQHSVLDVPQLDGLQQRLNASPFEGHSWPTGSVVAVQPAVAAAVVPKGSAGAARATMAGVVTATAVSGVPQYAVNGWPGGAAMASVLPSQPVMATLGTVTTATAYSTAAAAAARLMSHSSAPAATGQPIAARLVQPPQRSVSNAKIAARAVSPSPHAVAASPAAGSLTSALSSLSSSLASFANSPHQTRSPTPLMANLSLHQAQAAPATAVTATVMAAASPPSGSSFAFSPSAVDHTVASATSPSKAAAASPAAASRASALSASLARSPASPASGSSSLSPSDRSSPVIPAVALASDGTTLNDARSTPVSSSFSAQSELSSLDSFASLALASFSPSTNSSPLADSRLDTLASLAHTDGSFGDSASSASSTSLSGHTTAPVSASSRSSSYRSSDQPNKRSRSHSQHDPDFVMATSVGQTPSLGLRKNRSQQGLSKLDTTRTAPSLTSASSHQPRLSSSSSFSSLSSALSTASPAASSPLSPLPASGSFPSAVPASVVANRSPRRRTYSPRGGARRVVAASVVTPGAGLGSGGGSSDSGSGRGGGAGDGGWQLSVPDLQVLAEILSERRVTGSPAE